MVITIFSHYYQIICTLIHILILPCCPMQVVELVNDNI